jgi:hypothetical protein
MKKRMKLFATLTLVTVLLLGSSINVFAAPSDTKTSSLNYITEGYTEEGIHYIVYEVSTPQSDYGGITPNIAVSKTKTYKIIYEGHIIRPNIFNYKGYETDYKTIMSGTLYLQSFLQDRDLFFQKRTYATYKGTVHGII